MRPRPELDGLDRNPQTVVLQELDEASSPGFDSFRPVGLSCSMATFRLIADSAAGLIGATLVALFGPPTVDSAPPTRTARHQARSASTKLRVRRA